VRLGSDLFAPCPGYRPITPDADHDCADCAEQYGERACPDFQERFLRILTRELDLDLRQKRFLAHRVRVK
jgi:hypothetical protein